MVGKKALFIQRPHSGVPFSFNVVTVLSAPDQNYLVRIRWSDAGVSKAHPFALLPDTKGNRRKLKSIIRREKAVNALSASLRKDIDDLFGIHEVSRALDQLHKKT